MGCHVEERLDLFYMVLEGRAKATGADLALEVNSFLLAIHFLRGVNRFKNTSCRHLKDIGLLSDCQCLKESWEIL